MKLTHALAAVAAAIVAVPLAGTTANAGQVITNGGFESGALAPWVWGRMQFAADPSNLGNEWVVTNTNANSGAFSAEVNDNFELVQTFAPVPVADITSITFAAWLPVPGPAMAIDLFYSGNVDEETSVANNGGSWSSFDITSFLDHSQTNLVGISFFGDTASEGDPGNPSFLDDVSILANAGVPEPATWALSLVGVGFLGSALRAFRRKAEAAAAV